MTISYRPFLDFAAETAYRAGRLTLGYFHAGTRSEYKSDDSPVTGTFRVERLADDSIGTPSRFAI